MGKIASGPGLKRPPKLCVVAKWVAADLDEDDVAAIEDWFADRFSVADVLEHVESLMGESAPFSESSLTGHRARRCACTAPQPLQILPDDLAAAGG